STCAFRPAGQECRPATNPCDNAGTCSGSSATCPADVRKSVGDVCDDGDPTTGISSCNEAQMCTGVSTMVTLQPQTLGPQNEKLKKVGIPVPVAAPATAGNPKATALAQGLVNCLDVPPAFRPSQCGALPAVAAGFGARLESVFLRVTP